MYTVGDDFGVKYNFKIYTIFFCHSLTNFSSSILMCYRIKQYSLTFDIHIYPRICVLSLTFGVKWLTVSPQIMTWHTCLGTDITVSCQGILFNSVTHQD